jgi:hypothetical protein
LEITGKAMNVLARAAIAVQQSTNDFHNWCSNFWRDTLQKNSTTLAYISSWITTAIGGLTLQELAIWVGILSTAGTFLLNAWVKIKEQKRNDARLVEESRREAERHAALLEAIRDRDRKLGIDID